ncbi:MAG: DUF86 domain-containing protein [Eggerthellaceae bacterium]|nr:DUF86 domain-containing protein [Eggerthellaceae bacterium]
MKAKERNALERIVSFCALAQAAREKHFPTRKKFDEDRFYGDGIALYIQQIGECVNDLSDDFTSNHPEVEWHQIRGMRNIIAHAYEGVDPDIVWQVLTDDLPKLSRTCKAILK